MTLEKAIEFGKIFLKSIENEKGSATYEFVETAIKALKEQDILNKVKAEISDFEEEVFNRPNTDYSDYAAVRYCLEIIDKCKAESEVEE